MLQRLEKHLAVHNQTRSPWGPIDLRLVVGAWSGRSGRSFSEFLDEVESQLRHSAPEAPRNEALGNKAQQADTARSDSATAPEQLHDADTVRG